MTTTCNEMVLWGIPPYADWDGTPIKIAAAHRSRFPVLRAENLARQQEGWTDLVIRPCVANHSRTAVTS